jgi:hypothetical protein
VRGERLRAIQEDGRHRRTIRSGRRWILVVVALTVIGGLYSYGKGMSDLEEAVRQVEQVAGADPDAWKTVDASVRTETGMSWTQAVRHERDMLKFLLASNLILAALYLGLFVWASRQPFTAALIALLMFLTVQMVGIAVEPKTLTQGLIIKILIVVGLTTAVSAAYKHRQMQRNLAASQRRSRSGTQVAIATRRALPRPLASSRR